MSKVSITRQAFAIRQLGYFPLVLSSMAGACLGYLLGRATDGAMTVTDAILTVGLLTLTMVIYEMSQEQAKFRRVLMERRLQLVLRQEKVGLHGEWSPPTLVREWTYQDDYIPEQAQTSETEVH